VGRFDPATGAPGPVAESRAVTYTQAMGDALCALATQDTRIVAITAAMPEGTGLLEFSRRFPDRFFDVGICEQHAVTFAAGLATQGLRPFVCVYSTFLQRAYDQIVHDVCMQRLPVVFCLDRAGLVGEDGATHQGAFDLAYLRHIPHMTLFAPRDEAELQRGLVTGLSLGSPFALRYPRGAGEGTPLPEDLLRERPLPLGQGEFLLRGDGSLAALAVGGLVAPALAAARELAADGASPVTVCDARWIKPLPLDDLKEIAATHDKILLLEEGCLAGGFSSAVLEYLADAGLLRKTRVDCLGLPDAFVEHGPAPELRARLGLDRAGIAAKMREML
jgi:1-deoxy-D-xylulose-5-phosphate synthase